MYILDTHVIIWTLYDRNQLPERATKMIEEEPCCISIASLWEMAIKISLGKLRIKQSMVQIAELFRSQGVLLRAITPKDCDRVKELPFIHKDPFDRLIVAQSEISNLTIITKDAHIPQYSVTTLWE